MSERQSDHLSAFAEARSLLYRAFADVEFDPAMAHCRHCVSPEDLIALGSPVATLDAGVVARFVTKSGTTWGTSTDLRRVVPRALDLSAQAELPIHRSVFLEKLTNAGWASWPAPQVDAVCRFLLAEWSRLLSSTPRPGHAAHGWLRQTAGSVADLEPFLTAWQAAMWSQAPASGRRAATVHLAVLLVNSEFRPDFPESVALLFDDEPSGRSTNAGTVAPAAQLERWLLSTATESQLTHAAEDFATTSDSRRVQLAADRLRRYHAAAARSDVHAG